MPASAFDLQSHSTYSDGVLAPAEVVRRAAAAGVELFALSDHDTIEGVGEAVDAARAAGISLVTAVEISAVDPPHEDLHILGYGFDHEDPSLGAALADFRADRLQRSERMGRRLVDLGWEIRADVFDQRRAADLPIGRPHLAEAVVAHPANAARLADEGLVTPTDLLVAYLIPGTPAYSGRERPTVAAAIEAIHAAGGLAVWAHPFWDVEDPFQVISTIERFAALGLDGVEAFYITFHEEQVALLHATCLRLGLQTTGSADFHGPQHPMFSRFGAFSLFGLEPALDRIRALALS